jgi:DNA helicase-2/ATP-dependent DNA helicase PcrA
VRILRRDAGEVGYERDFSILDDADQLRLLKLCYDDVQADPKRFAPRAMLGRISDAKNRLLTPADMAREVGSFSDQVAVRLYERYQDRLRLSQAMDFDDLLMLTVELLEGSPEIRERYQRRFEHVLVDEYQDTNHAQYRIVRVLGEPQRNVCAVGDDDQGIYSWRGADVRNILDFERDYPDAHVVALEQNYRSSGVILRAANAVVSRNPGRHPKRLWTDKPDGELIRLVACRDEGEEARMVRAEIERAIEDGQPLAGIAVFYRTNAQSRAVEDVLVRSGIPYQVIGGPKFYERAEVRDLLAYLRVAANPADEVSFGRMIGAPKRGVGPACIGRLTAYGREHGIAIADVAANADLVQDLKPAQRRALRDVSALIADLRAAAAAGAPLDRLVEDALERSGLRAAFQAEHTIEAQGRLENLQELVRVAAEHQERAEAPSLQGFLEEITLTADADAVDLGTGVVTLMTVHNAKGLEFDRVLMIGMEEGLFPHARSETPEALQEERRLCYVGITRARERLVVSYAQSRAIHGGRDYRLPSRFLAELPAELLDEAPQVPAMAGAIAGGGARRIAEDFSAGDNIVHATFGEGVITGVEQGGELVLVRFANDGAERRLMAGYAPMRKAV